MTITVGDEMRLHVLHPPSQLLTNAQSDTNNNSVVIRPHQARFGSVRSSGPVSHTLASTTP
jgi:hypothetical protein